MTVRFAQPSELEEYRLIRLLGRGAMGEVWLGQDTLLDRPVAIKFLAGQAAGAEARERFLIEARAIARVRHPNVVAVYRAGTSGGRPYLVSELVEGQSLDRVPKPLSAERVVEIGLSLARGLAAAHSNGVLHRDVKPANVIVDVRGDVKLLDFGLAKLIDALPSPEAAFSELNAASDPEATLPGPSRAALGPAASPSITRAGALLGTPRYMSPEAWRGEPATAASDVYSTGAVLFELCAGRAPFPEATVDALREAALSTAAPPLWSVVPSIDARLAAIVDRCLRGDPALRFADASALAAALEELARSDLFVPPGVDPYRSLAPFEAEHRALFYGRATETRAILDLLKTEPLVTVIGDSGTGKSSLCRAGVLPRIAELGEGRTWSAAAIVPGRHPLDALCDALRAKMRGDGATLTSQSSRGADPDPLEMVASLRLFLGAERGLVLFVDQLEELVTESDAAQASLFVAVLSALGARLPGVRLLFAARGDFLTRLAALQGLDGLLARSLWLLAPLGREALREVIVGPARTLGVSFENEALIEEVAAGAESLPLLQFALSELWARRDVPSGVIPKSALDAIGGVSGALSRHADRVLAQLLPVQREAARRVLNKLVTVSGTRARRTAAELLSDENDRAALDALVRGRLIVARSDDREGATYELAHEALISSWPALASWLKNDAEKRALSERVAGAAAEWSRLGMPRDHLWSDRQLREVAALDLRELPERDRSFLVTSRSAVRKKRWFRAGLIAALPLIAGGAYAAQTLRAQWALEQRIFAQLETAETILAGARRETERSSEQQSVAFAAFDRAENEAAEELWTKAGETTAAAHQLYNRAQRAFETALLLDYSSPRLRSRYAEALFEHALLADRDHRPALRDELFARLQSYDDGTLAERWNTPGRLTLEGLKTGSKISLARYTNDNGRRVLGAASDRIPEQLEPGSYLLLAGGQSYPFELDRGEELRIQIVDPPPAPEGFVFVPPGRFYAGAAEEDDFRRYALRNVEPLHRRTTHAYFIGKYEVTFAEWIEFLEALPPAERASRLPKVSSVHGALELSANYVLSIKPTDQIFTAKKGENITYSGRKIRARQNWLKMPVSGISYADAQAYLSWLSQKIPGARLCTDDEWERAARGADARIYPHGDRLDPDDANHDRTYGRDPLGFGPDEVGSHPASNSPFGVSDLAGNVWEWVASKKPGEIVYRGGGWYEGVLESRSSNRELGEPTMRDLLIGLRVCAGAR